MEPIRSFIAIELPKQVKSTLSELEDNLRSSEHYSVRWVAPDGIHLTLKFLGNIVSENVVEIEKAISEAARGFAPFNLEIGKLGVFPNIQAPRVVWVGLEGEMENLLTLHNNIERTLIPLGFSPEGRAFSPHLTLGRVRESASPGERRRLGEIVTSLKVGGKVSFRIDCINLMRSQLTREGAVYSCLASVALESG